MTLNRNLAVLPIDDEAIFVSVDAALQRAPTLGAARIDVRSQDGYVTLKGVADTVADIATAGSVAGLVRGVTGVSNQIRVADRH